MTHNCTPAQKRGDIAEKYRQHAAKRSVEERKKKKNRLNDRVTLSARDITRGIRQGAKTAGNRIPFSLPPPRTPIIMRTYT